MESGFIKYIGPADIHDAVISSLEHHGETAEVIVNSNSKKVTIQFEGVKSIKSNRPQGMILYSLSEMEHPEHRLFVFSNWDEEDESYLEIIADKYNIKIT